uniref:DEAD/DEAH box RNA helicase putative n=1 Tax=Albugo laibachii Nc14 TaxID=890382 RepID=F0W7W2_9STRA|nr:DEAD/DEAH box RNA helicase putative [Albugo laibachii Nc14]CCA23690.1 DEAD/DEAH box RNA helicase putative [Albugo laibachii Nc14]|eukprot:CCA23690.1 DEAD/DEAH box RNA helicase putative [Albugo laibachii Nc14]
MLQKFALVDTSYCFLARQKALLSVQNIVNLATSLGNVSVTYEDVERMAKIAPLLMQIRPMNRRQIYKVFLISPQASQRASKKRQKIFENTFHSLESNSLEGASEPICGGEKVSATNTETIACEESEAKGSANDEQVTNKRRKENENDALNANEANIDTQNDIDTKAQIVERILAATARGHVCREWIESLRRMECFDNQFIHIEKRRAREAKTVLLEKMTFSERTKAALRNRGLESLYSHQARAIEAINGGSNVMLCTSTASGKSLSFIIPTIEDLLQDAGCNESSAFIYLFPTKALAQDQLRSVREYLMSVKLSPSYCCTFVSHFIILWLSAFHRLLQDGDTDIRDRAALIRDARIFLMNPDVLHHTVLPQHSRWKRILGKLRYIVVDESHMYRGVFGTHVSNVFRRLFRLCALYGAYPQTICCSASIGNPKQHFQNLIPVVPRDLTSSFPPQYAFLQPRDLELIEEDGSPSGEKWVCLWNPQASRIRTENSTKLAHVGWKKQKIKVAASSSASHDNATEISDVGEDTQRATKSPIFQSACIMSKLIEMNVHTLMFCNGRKLAELVLMNVQSILKKSKATKGLLRRVLTYRGGYSVKDRRSIEQRLFQGDLLGVVATNALELGIDVGHLDCTLHLGFPSSISSLWQQAGRAGRKHTVASLSIIICFDSPLDQYFCRHSDELFTLIPEAANLQLGNVQILHHHLVCAARESAIFSKKSGSVHFDSFLWPDNTLKTHVVSLVQEKKIIAGDEHGYQLHPCLSSTYRYLNLRSINDKMYKVLTSDDNDPDHWIELDEIPSTRAFFQVYPTAVYLHQGKEYLITHLNHEERFAIAERCKSELSYYSSCRDFTNVDIVRTFGTKAISTHARSCKTYLSTGVVSVTTSVIGSAMYKKRTMALIQSNTFSLPPMQHISEALWIDLPSSIQKQFRSAGYNWNGSLHGVGHLLTSLVPLFIRCDPGDIDTEHYHPKEQRSRPRRITMYEKREGGTGIVSELQSVFAELVTKSFALLIECSCLEGCPSCVHSTRCTEHNEVLDKEGARCILKFIIESISSDTLPIDAGVADMDSACLV